MLTPEQIQAAGINTLGQPNAPVAPSFGRNTIVSDALQRAGLSSSLPAEHLQFNPDPNQVPAKTAPTGDNVGTKLGKALDTTPVPPGPGGWAKSILAGAQKVLSGAGDISTEPTSQPTNPFGSFVEGFAETQKNKNARETTAKQQEFENQRKLKEEDQKQQQLDQNKLVNDSTIAHNNLENVKTIRMLHESGLQELKDGIARDAEVKKEYLSDDPTSELATDLTQTEVEQKMAQTDKDHPDHPLVTKALMTGLRDTGKKDKDGEPVYDTLYSLFRTPQERKLSAAQAKDWNDKGLAPAGGEFHEGDTLLGHQIHTLETQASAVAADRALMSKTTSQMLDDDEHKAVMDTVNDRGFDKQWHDILAAAKKNDDGTANPNSVLSVAERLGVKNAADVVAQKFGGRAQFDKMLDYQNKIDVEERRAQAEIEKASLARTAALNDQTDVFGNRSTMKDTDFQKRYTQFSNSALFKNLQQLDNSYAQFRNIQSNMAKNGGHINGPESVAGLFDAIGISAEPVKGAGLRINKNVIDEHVNARGLDQSLYQKLLNLKVGDVITPQQLQDYAKIATDVYKQQYVSAADEQFRQLHYIDVMPRGHNEPIDPVTMDIYMKVAGNKPELAASAASNNGWVVTQNSFGPPDTPTGTVGTRTDKKGVTWYVDGNSKRLGRAPQAPPQGAK